MPRRTEIILRWFDSLPEGALIRSRDLEHLVNRTQASRELTGLAKVGRLMRVARGMYVAVTVSRFGPVPPPVDKVVQSLAQITGHGIVRHGAAAANALGLTTQVPVRQIFLTDGPAQMLYLGKQVIEVRHVPGWMIVPFALVDTGLRWHVRAFDRKSGEFRDFVVTRIEAPQLLDEEPKANERSDNDIQWTRIVELDLVPHPRLSRPEIVRMDYGMEDGSIRMRVRAAVAGYMLLRWSVDASPDHSLQGPEYRLWLKDHLALYGVKNALLAPGYREPRPDEAKTNY